MSNIKKAISLKKTIFDEVESINSANAGAPDANEKNVQRLMRRKQCKIIQGQW
jgi:hypothetical protein